jgi:hypothetical protein
VRHPRRQHQWRAPPRAALYEALWPGVPLVHNSPQLAAAGLSFAYEGADVDGGAAALAAALAAPPEVHAAKRAASLVLDTGTTASPAGADAGELANAGEQHRHIAPD